MTNFERVGAAVAAFPLSWPTGWPRCTSRTDGRFGRADAWSIARAREELARQLELLGARSITLSTNLERRLDGLPRGKQAQPEDPGASVWFTLNGKPTVLACDRWWRVEHNIRALALHIDALRGMERWGVGSMAQAFAGYTALPETASSSSSSPWWEVLESEPNLPLEVYEQAYRRLALLCHPDKQGGSHEAMIQLNAARDAARAARKAS